MPDPKMLWSAALGWPGVDLGFHQVTEKEGVAVRRVVYILGVYRKSVPASLPEAPLLTLQRLLQHARLTFRIPSPALVIPTGVPPAPSFRRTTCLFPFRDRDRHSVPVCASGECPLLDHRTRWLLFSDRFRRLGDCLVLIVSPTQHTEIRTPGLQTLTPQNLEVASQGIQLLLIVSVLECAMPGEGVKTVKPPMILLGERAPVLFPTTGLQVVQGLAEIAGRSTRVAGG